MNAKYILEIDNKSIEGYLIGIINNLPYTRVKKAIDQKLTPTKKKSKLYKEIEEAIHELNEIKAGRKTARDARDFLNELQG